MRCVLPHTQRCHESKACTSPATALYFPQNKQPQRQQAAGARAKSKWANLITLDYVLRKGAQSNWSGKQARICVLCDAFCPTHSAATSQRHAPAPRQRCIFLKTNSHSDSRRLAQGAITGVLTGRGSPPYGHAPPLSAPLASAPPCKKSGRQMTQKKRQKKQKNPPPPPSPPSHIY